MKYRIRKTNEIVDVVGYSACTHIRYPNTDYVCYIDNGGNEIIGRGLNLIWDFEPITEEYTFDWQSFRNQAAKDIMCAMISNEGVADESSVDDFTKDNQVKDAVLYADKLISKLKEKEEK